MHPQRRERSRRRGAGLRDLVLVMRELRSMPPPWMSKCGPSSAIAIAEHSMCQPGRPAPHGESQRGSPGFAAFHSTKSSGSRLASSTSTRAPGAQVVELLAGQLAVAVETSRHANTDVAVRGDVRIALLDQLLDHRDDLGHVLGGPRLEVRAQHAERGAVLVDRRDEALGERLHRSRRSRCARLMILSSMSVMLRTKVTS